MFILVANLCNTWLSLMKYINIYIYTHTHDTCLINEY